MQSFASPFPQPPHQSPTPQKSRTTFYTTPHKKGATIAYTHALSTKKNTERAQLSPMPQEKSLLNPLNPCEPSPTQKVESVWA